MKITRQLLQDGRSTAGAWNRKQIELLGIAWPPIKGWPKRLEGREISDANAAEFVRLKNAHKKQWQKDAAEARDLLESIDIKSAEQRWGI